MKSLKRITIYIVAVITFTIFENKGIYGFQSQQNSKLKQTVLEVSENSLLKHGEWSCTVIDVESKKPIVDLNSNKSVAPASNLKLFTTAAALVELGSEFRFKTTLGFTGQAVGEVLEGDLVIVGCGDPTLGSTQVKGNKGLNKILERFAEAVHELGIKKINGKIVADISYFDPISIPDGWPWVDIGNYYGAGPSALCIHDNFYSLYFKPGKKVNDPATILYTTPKIPGIEFVNYMKTGPVGSGDNGYIYGGTGGHSRILRGTIPAGVNRFSIKGSIPNPPLFFIQSLKEQLNKTGISVAKDPAIAISSIPISHEIFSIQSPSLKEIVYWINKKSINLYTEVLLKHLGKITFGAGSFENGIKAIEEFVTSQGVPTEGMFLFDGSGLSPQNAITTKQMAILLRSMALDSTFENFYNSLPIAGVRDDDGQLGYLCRGTAAANNVRAKTGLINRVRAHSGYVKTKSGKLLCFSMIANDHTGSTRQIDRLHEKVMVELANLK